MSSELQRSDNSFSFLFATQCDPTLKNLTLMNDDFQNLAAPGTEENWYSFLAGPTVNKNPILEFIETEKDELLVWKVKVNYVEGIVSLERVSYSEKFNDLFCITTGSKQRPVKHMRNQLQGIQIG